MWGRNKSPSSQLPLYKYNFNKSSFPFSLQIFPDWINHHCWRMATMHHPHIWITSQHSCKWIIIQELHMVSWVPGCRHMVCNVPMAPSSRIQISLAWRRSLGKWNVRRLWRCGDYSIRGECRALGCVAVGTFPRIRSHRNPKEDIHSPLIAKHHNRHSNENSNVANNFRSGIWENCRAAYEDIVKHLER